MNKIQKYIEKAKATVNYGECKSKNPLLIILMGLPGSGKSYLADYLNKNIILQLYLVKILLMQFLEQKNALAVNTKKLTRC